LNLVTVSLLNPTQLYADEAITILRFASTMDTAAAGLQCSLLAGMRNAL